MPIEQCPICLNKYSDPAKVTSASGGFRVDCPVCGRFGISEEAWEDFLDPETGAGHLLSELCRVRLAHRIRTGVGSTASTPVNMTRDFISHFIADGCLGPTPAEQAINIIKYIGGEVSLSGHRLNTLPVDFFTIIGAPNPTLAGELAMELRERGLIDGIPHGSLNTPPSLLQINLTLDGWEQYESEKLGKISSNYGFIAMKFYDPALDSFVADIVKPAVKAGIGYDLFDMRDVAQAGIIDNIMRGQIRDSAFVIVDLTHDNFGAYWEAGYAEGLGKPVVYICERKKFESKGTHFDTNHCTTVVWSEDDYDKFKAELVATLRNTLNLF